MRSKLLLAVVLSAIGLAVYATSTAKYYRSDDGNRRIKGDVAIAGQLAFDGDEVALTSPTATFDVTGMSLITLTSDANLTGVRPTGGELNQLIVLVAGSGSNTMRFDNTSTMVLGGANKTMTEGSGDPLLMLCTNANGVEWLCLSDETASAKYFASLETPSVDINGGAIDGATIGANAAAPGKFTDVTKTGRTYENSEAVATTATLKAYGVSVLDGTVAGVVATLGTATYIGQEKIVVMQTAGNTVTLSATNHVTSDPEIWTFDAVGEVVVLKWTGTEWMTVAEAGVTKP